MDPSQIGAQLERILASARFAQAARLCRFLKLVVEATQSGEAESLKEYRIGVEVYDRGKNFDPRIDPIVRVEAARLRTRLTEYYAAEGAGDPIVIRIPKGTYVPEIRPRVGGDVQAAAASAGSPPSAAAAPGAGAARAPTASSAVVPGDAPGVANAGGITAGAPAASRPATASASALDRSRIAVLPFVNISPDPDNEYFSDGLTEELINRLAGVPSLQVVARTSMFRFKGRNEDVREIGAQVGAGTVLEGSVRKFGDQVRVTAQLIDVGSGYHLFSRTYQREYGGIFELQDELARSVVDEVVPRARGESGPVLARINTADPEAYSLYLRGMFALSNHAPFLAPAAEMFRRALEKAPAYAPAWAGLSQCYWLLAWYDQMPSKEAMPLAKEAAQTALELDPDSAQGHCSLGIVESGFEWRWASAERHFQRALELQPSLAITYPFYGVVCLLPQLRLDEACRMAERSLSLDPFNVFFYTIAIFLYANAERYDDADRQHSLAVEINPRSPGIVGSIAISHESAGRLDEAIRGYRVALELTGGHPHFLSLLGHALAVAGQKAEARRLLKKLLDMKEPPDLDVAGVYLGLRNAEEALRWLETSAEQRNIHLLTIPADRRFEWLRPHPRFQAILRVMSLPDGTGT